MVEQQSFIINVYYKRETSIFFMVGLVFCKNF